MPARTTTSTDTVAAIYESFAHGDIDSVMNVMDDAVEWITPATLPWSRGAYRGRDGLREYFGGFLAALSEPSVHPDELIAAGDRVIAIGYERGRGARSGREFRARFVHTWTVRDGRVTRMEGVVDTATIAAALAA